MPTPVIFDLDGTLIDSAPDIHATANRVLGQEGLPGLSFETVRGFIGNGVGVLIARVLGAHGLPGEGDQHRRMVHDFTELYETAVTLTVLYPNVAQTLTRLLAEGRKLGLCTNKPIGPTRAVLAHFGLSDTFEVIIGGDSLPQRKPDPAPLLHVVQALGGRAVYVGDSEVDAECADRARVPMALFTPGYRKTPLADLPHAAAFDDFLALPAIVANLS